jgi:hypothetical protein
MGELDVTGLAVGGSEGEPPGAPTCGGSKITSISAPQLVARGERPMTSAG